MLYSAPKGRFKWNSDNTKILIDLRFSKKYMEMSKTTDTCDLWKELQKEFILKVPTLSNLSFKDLRVRFRRVVREYGLNNKGMKDSVNTEILKKHMKNISNLSEFCYDYPKFLNQNLSQQREEEVFRENERRKKIKKEEIEEPKRKTVARKSSVKKVEYSESDFYFEEKKEERQADLITRDEYQREIRKILDKIDAIYNLLRKRFEE